MGIPKDTTNLWSFQLIYETICQKITKYLKFFIEYQCFTHIFLPYMTDLHKALITNNLAKNMLKLC